MQLLNANGEVYFGATGLDISANADGSWVDIAQFVVVSLCCELSLGVTAVSGDLYAEFTNDPAKVKCISRVVIPEGALHTSFATVTLPTARTAVAIASGVNASTFTVTFSTPGSGFLRWRWTRSGGGSSPNRLFGFLTGAVRR